MQGPHEFRSLSSVIGAFAPCTINGAQGGPQVKLGVGLSFGTMQLTDLSIGAPTLPRFPPRRSALAGEKLGGSLGGSLRREPLLLDGLQVGGGAPAAEGVLPVQRLRAP